MSFSWTWSIVFLVHAHLRNEFDSPPLAQDRNIYSPDEVQDHGQNTTKPMSARNADVARWTVPIENWHSPVPKENAGQLVPANIATESYDGLMDQLIDEQASGMVQEMRMRDNPDNSHNTESALLWSSGRIHLLTVDTHGPEKQLLRGPPTWKYAVTNLGSGKEWTGFKTKIARMNAALHHKISDIADEDIVVFVDGGDTMYGGCKQSDFLNRFTKILNVTNAQVIVAAEYNCAEVVNCTEFPDNNRETVLQAFGLSREAVDRWAPTKNCFPVGCSLRYLNSGFYAGYKKDLKWFTSEVLNYYEKYRFTSDQGYVSRLFIDHPEKIVLDYAGALVNCLYGVVNEMDDRKLYEFDKSREVWVNNVLKDDVCFFHGNGKTKFSGLPLKKGRKKDDFTPLKANT